MEPVDFAKTWSDLWMERQNLLNRRTDLETELSEIRSSISHLDEILAHLGPLAGVADTVNNLPALGITGAIRLVLQTANGRLSAQEIRKALTDQGYDLSSLSAPMASIYKVVSRLEEAEEIEREKEDGRVYFKWKLSPITDEDIPF
jgi:hypothetical protein